MRGEGGDISCSSVPYNGMKARSAAIALWGGGNDLDRRCRRVKQAVARQGEFETERYGHPRAWQGIAPC